MILPTKGVSRERALLTVGGEILQMLQTPKSISALWDAYATSRERSEERVTFDWFAHAATMLFAVGLIDLDDDGYIRKRDANH